MVVAAATVAATAVEGMVADRPTLAAADSSRHPAVAAADPTIPEAAEVVEHLDPLAQRHLPH